MASLKDRFNGFLESSRTLASYDELRLEALRARKGHAVSLVGALALGGACSLLISFAASVLGYGSASRLLIWSLLGTVLNMLIGNLIFALFVMRVRGEAPRISMVRRFGRLIGVQILCAISLIVMQYLVYQIAVLLTLIDGRVYLMANAVVSVAFTLLNALVAFRVCDGASRLRDVMPGIFKVAGGNARPLLILSLLFLVWSAAASLAYVALFSDRIPSAEGASNVFHLLMGAREFALLAQVVLFNLVNLLVAGFFEVTLLLGLAICYERDKERCF